MATDGTTINIEAQDTTFERNGLTTQTIQHIGDALPINQISGSASFPLKPGFSRTAVAGTSNLASLFNNPFDYENATSALYTRTMAVAYAMAQSGPASVRGGTARVGFALGEAVYLAGINRYKEIWTAWIEWAKVTVESVSRYNEIFRSYDQQTLADNEQQVMHDHAAAQLVVGFFGQLNAQSQATVQAFAAARHYGTQIMTTNEAVAGLGIQGPSTTPGFGSANWR